MRSSGGRAALPAPALVLLAVVSVQTGAAVASGLFDQVGPAGAVTLRLVLAAAVLLPLARPALAGLRRARGRRDLLPVLGFGVVLGGMNLAFYEALARLPLGIAVTIEFCGPLAVAVLTSRRWQDLGWALLAALGIGLLADGGAVTTAGVLFALVAAACWAGYILLSQRVGQTWTGLSGLALAMTVAAVLVLPLGVAAAGSALLSPGVLLAGAGLALLSSVVPYSLELQALRRLRAGVFAVLLSLEPAVAALVGLLLLGQVLAPLEVVAVLVVVVACLGATRPPRQVPGAVVPPA